MFGRTEATDRDRAPQATTMARAKKKAAAKLPIFVLYNAPDGTVRRACFRAAADKVRTGMGARAKQAIVEKFFLRFPDLGVSDAAPFEARTDTDRCRAEREERSHREGVAVLEVCHRDDWDGEVAEGEGPAMESTYAKWTRPAPPSLDPVKDSISFQQVELDHYIGKARQDMPGGESTIRS